MENRYSMAGCVFAAGFFAGSCAGAAVIYWGWNGKNFRELKQRDGRDGKNGKQQAGI